MFVFFGLLGARGNDVDAGAVGPWWLWMSASALGLLSVATMANNIRGIPTDRESRDDGGCAWAIARRAGCSRRVWASGRANVLGVAVGLHPATHRVGGSVGGRRMPVHRCLSAS